MARTGEFRMMAKLLPSRSLAVLATTAILAGMTGCTADDKQKETTAAIPSPVGPRLGKCPTLTGRTAEKVGQSGEGSPRAGSVEAPFNQIKNCGWGSGPGAIRMSISVNFNNDSTPAAQWKTTLDKEAPYLREIAEDILQDLP